ncbi:family 43 glycosylhydrolase [bacterium]|nr:family 43 glycosylhydrolase [bacterium]
MKIACFHVIGSLCLWLCFTGTFAQNPLIMDQFTADPSARVFKDRVYMYPSHDENCGTDWFCMKDYHVFSSQNLTDWTDHGVIISQGTVPWVDSTFNSLWAPDCIKKDSLYYFYFPAITRNQSKRRMPQIGVAVSNYPYGPFKPEPEPMNGVFGIDPNPFIDKDGQAYLYWAAHRCLYMARLKENMKELASEPKEVKNLPSGFKEGPYLFERNGSYYFSFPHVIKKTEAIVYAIGKNPMGPFEYKGIIMDESPTGCWTNHHSILEYQGHWYLFYHHNDLSPDFDKNRSVRADSLFFNEDGTIQKVIPTLRGVGLTSAMQKIQIDRFSKISDKGTLIRFLDEQNKMDGWKTILNVKGAWIQYNSVDFGDQKVKSANIKIISEKTGHIELRIDDVEGPVVAHIKITQDEDWHIINSALDIVPAGIHDLVVVQESDVPVEIDWIRFE